MASARDVYARSVKSLISRLHSQKAEQYGDLSSWYKLLSPNGTFVGTCCQVAIFAKGKMKVEKIHRPCAPGCMAGVFSQLSLKKEYMAHGRSLETTAVSWENFARRFLRRFSRSIHVMSGSPQEAHSRMSAKPCSGPAAVMTLSV